MGKRKCKAEPTISAELLARLPPLPDPIELKSAQTCLDELNRLRRGRHRAQLTREQFTEGLYALQVGSPLVKVIEENNQRDRIIEALHHSRGATDGTAAVEYLPADSATDPLEVLP